MEHIHPYSEAKIKLVHSNDKTRAPFMQVVQFANTIDVSDSWIPKIYIDQTIIYTRQYVDGKAHIWFSVSKHNIAIISLPGQQYFPLSGRFLQNKEGGFLFAFIFSGFFEFTLCSCVSSQCLIGDNGLSQPISEDN